MLALQQYFKSKHIWLATILCGIALSSSAQHFEINNAHKSVTIPFRLVRNMVVIKLTINDKGPFNFILDTGVGIMIITDPHLTDSIPMPNRRTIKLSGLAEGDDYEALVTPELNIHIPGINSVGVGAAILNQDYFNLSGFVGMPIHGLLGYDFFAAFAVRVNFEDSTITVCKPQDLKKTGNMYKVPITIEDRKPYMETSITFPGGKKMKNKLIIDLGAGHPLSLENLIAKNGLPPKFIAANLGVALNGPISGYISRIEEINIGKYRVKKVITSFPDVDYEKRGFAVLRDGNLGIGILKRFHVVFDYTNSVMYVKPNSVYKTPYEFDMSGMEYYAGGENYQHLIVSRVSPGSPAAEIGLEKDDEIVSINLKPVSQIGIEEVDAIFKSKDERALLLEIYHDNRYDKVVLTLKRRI
ncbi:aspartyl protease family protein [Mucilaginibacter glaciei]|uniref:Aspartyl protease family protein n=1 Tax=Mucilaginibacter glaciei TaxID=2772109 RepID=A0A926NXN3_9SPHI|nr:aspartyl protease family protein [Mucilaginibacter glaciei]MBD1393718.1 aspartyl protease family protein [Mucilaginibacter glaciei]